MKFTKEEAFESLKGILTNNGRKTLRMSERTINAHLDTLMPLIANEEMELTDFIEKVKDVFQSTNSNVEKDNADFVKGWKKEHPETQTTTTTTSQTSNENDDLVKLREEMNAMKAELENAKKERSIKTKRRELLDKMVEKGINKDWATDFLGEVSVSEDIDIDSKVDSYLKIYNRQKATIPPTKPPRSAGGTSKVDEKCFEDYKRAVKQREENEKH